MEKFFPHCARHLFFYLNIWGKRTKIGKYVLHSPLLLRKIRKNSWSIIVKRYISSNSFRIFRVYVRFLNSKTYVFAFIFFESTSAPKILKKCTEVYLSTIIVHEFFHIFLSNRGLCRKSFPIFAFFAMIFK